MAHQYFFLLSLLSLLTVSSSALAEVTLTIHFSSLTSHPQFPIIFAILALASAMVTGFAVFLRHAVIKSILMAATIAGAWYSLGFVTQAMMVRYNGIAFAISVASVTYVLIALACEIYDYYAGPLPLSKLTERMETNPRGTQYKLQQPEYVQGLIDQLQEPEREIPILLELIGAYLTHTPCYSLFGYKNWRTQATSLNPEQAFREFIKPVPFYFISRGILLFTVFSVASQLFYYIYAGIWAPNTITPGSISISLQWPFIAFVAFTLFKMYRRHKLIAALRRLKNFYFRCASQIAGHYYHVRMAQFILELGRINRSKEMPRAEKTEQKCRLIIAFFNYGRQVAANYELPERFDLYECMRLKIRLWQKKMAKKNEPKNNS